MIDATESGPRGSGKPRGNAGATSHNAGIGRMNDPPFAF